MSRFRLLNDFTHENYSILIECACKESQYFSLTTFKYYHKKDLNNSYFELLSYLTEYEQDKFKFNLPKHYSRAHVHVYELNQNTKSILFYVNKLYDWCPPYFPEDLCFYKGKKIWFESISHEHMSFLYTENINLKILPKQFEFIELTIN